MQNSHECSAPPLIFSSHVICRSGCSKRADEPAQGTRCRRRWAGSGDEEKKKKGGGCVEVFLSELSGSVK